MSNYFDNQANWSWNVSDSFVKIETDHGSHTHTIDITNATIGDMYDNLGQTMGDAHRAADHNYK